MTQPSQLRDTSEPATVPIPAQPGPVQDASQPAPPEPAEPAEPASSADEPSVIPAVTDGTTLHGEYEGGGYDEPRYLIARGDGQMVLVSRMLNEVAPGTNCEAAAAIVILPAVTAKSPAVAVMPPAVATKPALAVTSPASVTSRLSAPLALFRSERLVAPGTI